MTQTTQTTQTMFQQQVSEAFNHITGDIAKQEKNFSYTIDKENKVLYRGKRAVGHIMNRFQLAKLKQVQILIDAGDLEAAHWLYNIGVNELPVSNEEQLVKLVATIDSL